VLALVVHRCPAG